MWGNPMPKPSERLLDGMNKEEKAQYQKAWEKTITCKIAAISDVIRQIGNAGVDATRKIRKHR
jgi:hypothetical protein